MRPSSGSCDRPASGPARVLRPRSRDWPIRTLLGSRRPRSYTWRPRTSPFDQGREGACVGFAWAHELVARPHVVPADDSTALSLYRRAQQLDEWPGEDYSGTSVLAGIKACRELGHYPAFRWAFGLEDVVAAIGWAGPVVLGIPWHESMYEAPDGWVRVDGRVVGGHAIMAHGVNLPGPVRHLAELLGRRLRPWRPGPHRLRLPRPAPRRRGRSLRPDPEVTRWRLDLPPDPRVPLIVLACTVPVFLAVLVLLLARTY